MSGISFVFSLTKSINGFPIFPATGISNSCEIRSVVVVFPLVPVIVISFGTFLIKNK